MARPCATPVARSFPALPQAPIAPACDQDRKSTRLNSSHLVISYAVFCLTKEHLAHREAHPRRTGEPGRPDDVCLGPPAPDPARPPLVLAPPQPPRPGGVPRRA